MVTSALEMDLEGEDGRRGDARIEHQEGGGQLHVHIEGGHGMDHRAGAHRVVARPTYVYVYVYTYTHTHTHTHTERFALAPIVWLPDREMPRQR